MSTQPDLRRIRAAKHLAVIVCLAAASACASARPASSASSSDEALKARVSGALAASSTAAAKTIAVDVSGGVVTLTGKVGDSYELQDLGALVRSVPGVRSVRFSVKIEPAGAPPGGR